MISVDRLQLRQLCPSTAVPLYLFGNMEEVLFDYGINDSPRRLAHFFAQVLHETSGLISLVESFDYSAEQIAARWPGRCADVHQALPYAHNPIVLANRVYGRCFGNREPGDGWWFLRRGLLRIVGRTMYERIGQRLDVDLLANPHLVVTPDYALPAACEVWTAAKCNALADRNDVIGLMRALTGNNGGLASCWTWLARTSEIWPQGH